MSYSTGHAPHFDLCSTFEVKASGEAVHHQPTSEHGGWELLFLPAGVKQASSMELRGRRHVLTPGKVLLFNGEEKHTEHFGADESATHRVDAVVLYPDFLEKLLAPLGVKPGEVVFESAELANAPRALSLLRALMEFRATPAVSRFSYDCLVTDFATELSLNEAHSHGARVRAALGTGHYPADVSRAKAAIRDRLLDPSLRVDDLARAAGLSKFHFIRAFRRETGLTPSEAVCRLRVDLAKRAMKKGRPVTEAALGSGFASLSTFQKAFRRHAGMPASALVAAARQRG